MKELLIEYRSMLGEIDTWFGLAGRNFPKQIACRSGCSSCCSGLFDITLMEAALLQEGFNSLSAVWQQVITERAITIKNRLAVKIPNLEDRYTINHLPEELWAQPDESETPCLFLDDTGACLVYDYRPSTCRLHGLPVVDTSGEVFQTEYCTLNFTNADPREERQLRHPFRELFTREIELYKRFSTDLFKTVDLENDTYIPIAIFIDLEEIANKHSPSE